MLKHPKSPKRSKLVASPAKMTKTSPEIRPKPQTSAPTHHLQTSRLKIISQGAAAPGSVDMGGTVGRKPPSSSDLEIFGGAKVGGPKLFFFVCFLLRLIIVCVFFLKCFVVVSWRFFFFYGGHVLFLCFSLVFDGCLMIFRLPVRLLEPSSIEPTQSTLQVYRTSFFRTS